MSQRKFIFRAQVEDRNCARSGSFNKFFARHRLQAVTFIEIAANYLLHFSDIPLGDPAQRGQQVENAVVGKLAVDELPIASACYETGAPQVLEMLRGVKALLPRVQESLPSSLDLHAVGDQSIFVKAAVFGVVREAALAAALVGLMILLFLGSWRSTVIILIEIPLAILFSLTVLSWLGETINVMTLGGLALAVGILVDDGTVTIENINYHLEQGKSIEPAILDGAQQIVIPAFVTLLCLCIVFVPMFQLGGVAGYLFRPLAEAVVFALIGSFILSRTLVPTMANYLMQGPHVGHHDASSLAPRSRNPLKRFQQGFERRFAQVRDRYRALLVLALSRPKIFITSFLTCVVVSFGLWPFLGQNFFPEVELRANSDARARPTWHSHRGECTVV